MDVEFARHKNSPTRTVSHVRNPRKPGHRTSPFMKSVMQTQLGVGHLCKQDTIDATRCTFYNTKLAKKQLRLLNTVTLRVCVCVCVGSHNPRRKRPTNVVTVKCMLRFRGRLVTIDPWTIWSEEDWSLVYLNSRLLLLALGNDVSYVIRVHKHVHVHSLLSRWEYQTSMIGHSDTK